MYDINLPIPTSSSVSFFVCLFIHFYSFTVSAFVCLLFHSVIVCAFVYLCLFASMFECLSVFSIVPTSLPQQAVWDVCFLPTEERDDVVSILIGVVVIVIVMLLLSLLFLSMLLHTS